MSALVPLRDRHGNTVAYAMVDDEDRDWAQSRHRDYHSGHGRGVCFHEQTGRWMAYLDRPGEQRCYLGLHDSEEAAAEAVSRAKEEALNAVA